ncbi:Gfo/Idh/MocA family oxidoreductase [Chitinimonas sp.]|uniref:Gfo/Idh/MocA family protein n=1 Tax=Chitinimonas sp. TaxID=1934313 RepID=UPI002F91D910
MQQAIRWGILGTGGIARQLAIAVNDTEGAVLQAVASRSGPQAARFAAEHGSRSHYPSYAELVADPQVEVVYIATPHAQHYAAVMLCLEAGKAVLCEKPFTLNAREARQAITYAKARGLFLMEAMWTRFIPAIREAEAMVARGEIGRVHAVQADFGFHHPFEPAHRLYDPALGGGALLDIGIYPLALGQLFLGPVASTNAQAELGQSGVDEQTAFSLQHAGGGMTGGFCSLRAQTPWEATLMGERGSIRLHSPFFKPERLTLTRDGVSTTSEYPHRGNGYGYEVEEVNRCLRAGLCESPRMPWADTLISMDALDTIRAQIGLRYPGE